MLKTLQPYPEEIIGDTNAPSADPNQYYTICIALRELYLQIPDPEIRLKLRYIATLVKTITDHFSQYDPVWFHAMYPRVREYDKLMRTPKEAINE